MTDEQRKKLWQLIYEYGRVSTELGAVPSSYGWNSVAAKQDTVEQMLRAHIETIPATK